MTPEEFYAILYDVPDTKPVVYRLYHDDQGRPLFYSMEDLAGTWIAIDAAAYAQARHDVRVIDGKIVELPKVQNTLKLRPSDEGVACDPRDICIIVDDKRPHVKWSLG